MHKISPMPAAKLTKREAAEVLGVHLSTVNRLVDKGELRAEKVGGAERVGMYLFARSDVERLARKRAAGRAA